MRVLVNWKLEPSEVSGIKTRHDEGGPSSVMVGDVEVGVVNDGPDEQGYFQVELWGALSALCDTDCHEGEITHKCPPPGGVQMPCCGKRPFEVAITERMTSRDKLVTCQGAKGG